MEFKNFKMSIQDATPDGSFKALVSVYGVKDQVGDIVVPGAFSKTLQERGAKVPLFFNHGVKDGMKGFDLPIGHGLVSDGAKALSVDGSLCVDSDLGRNVYALMKHGDLDHMSFGYDTIQHERANGAKMLKELKLWEASVVTFPVNTDAKVLTVKSFIDEMEMFAPIIAEKKAGRRLSADTVSQLKTILDKITALLKEEDDSEAAESMKAMRRTYHAALSQISVPKGLINA